jgi:hypothetical protein
MAWTNRGVKRILDIAFRAQNIPTHWYAVLCTDAAAPARTTNTMAELTQIATGNGYTTGGYQLTRNTTDWVDLNEDDSTHFASTVAKDVVWTASGGTLPSSGTARYLVITDDHATLNSREIIAYFDLGGNTSVSSGQPLTAVDLTLKLSPSA